MVRFALCKEVNGARKYLVQDEFSGDVSNHYDLEKAILFKDEYIAKLVSTGGEYPTVVRVSVVYSVVAGNYSPD